MSVVAATNDISILRGVSQFVLPGAGSALGLLTRNTVLCGPSANVRQP
ncbi:hypothetical protein BZL30_8341 [Mycobacterium kansasii]|uniref:Uncharacterized protein n=1 Tax=Mycobacterium kansasii TaxID=1768 RepID=A0A1V3WI45_MYCKA|nr:hypothetical protein BZL30_8341 [Mycobacterium kansasii]